MVIELLKFKLAPEHREQFIQLDADIWTPALSQYPGFISKQVWINPNDATEITMVITWSERDLWKSIPLLDLNIITYQFDQMCDFEHKMIESSEYEVVADFAG